MLLKTLNWSGVNFSEFKTFAQTSLSFLWSRLSKKLVMSKANTVNSVS